MNRTDTLRNFADYAGFSKHRRSGVDFLEAWAKNRFWLAKNNGYIHSKNGITVAVIPVGADTVQYGTAFYSPEDNWKYIPEIGEYLAIIRLRESAISVPREFVEMIIEGLETM